MTYSNLLVYMVNEYKIQLDFDGHYITRVFRNEERLGNTYISPNMHKGLLEGRLFGSIPVELDITDRARARLNGKSSELERLFEEHNANLN